MRKRPVVSQLEKQFSRVRDEHERINERLVALGATGTGQEFLLAKKDAKRELMAAIVTCIQLFEPRWTTASLAPKRHRTRRIPFAYNELLKMAYDELRRTEPIPTTTKEILEGMWLGGGISRETFTDHHTRSALTAILRAQEKVGAVRSDGRRPLRWTIIRPPTQSS